MKTVYVLQGLPGSGKSTLAKYINNELDKCGFPYSDIVSADKFFMKEGKYQFDASKLSSAHEFCFNEFVTALKNGWETIVVDNTNTTKREYQRYVDAAKLYDYRVVLLTLNNFMTDEELSKTSVHNVPAESIAIMRQRMKNQ